jgi:hypothetical protein
MEPLTMHSRRWTTRCFIGAIGCVALGIVVLLTETWWGAVLAIFAYLVAFLFMLNSPNSVMIDDTTVTIRNGLKVRRVQRADITGVTFNPIGWFSPRCATLQVGSHTVKMFTAYQEWVSPGQVSPVGGHIATTLGFAPSGERLADDARRRAS